MFFCKIRSLPSSNWSTHYTLFVYRPQLRCGKVMFLHLCVILFSVCPSIHHRSHDQGGVSVWGGSLSGVFVWVGLGPGGSLGGLCPGGSLSGAGLLGRETPRTVSSGRYASYWNAFLLLKVSILQNGQGNKLYHFSCNYEQVMHVK